MIIYSKSTGQNPAAIDNLETPIKMIIEHESQILTKAGGVAEKLFNIEKSNRFGETIVAESEFDVFKAASEGAAAERDTVKETYSKFIEHIQFMKEFVITAEMMEDAQYGIAADTKRRAEAFTRAYYKTMNKLCEHALINATSASSAFAGATLDLTAPDSLPLFSSQHKISAEAGGTTLANYFYGNIFSTGASGSRKASVEAFEESLSALAVKLSGMLDENGEPLGYTADTIVLPGNRPIAENIAKKVVGTSYGLGGSYGDINVHYGNWNIVVLPGWISDKDSVMIMSSEANKALGGNMLFNRVPLTVTSWVDNHTGNYIWNGRCRFGVGFGSYKHILLATDSADSVSGATKL